jgi:hypothetical protein
MFSDPNPNAEINSLPNLPGSPGPLSLACLSCHDGTLAENAATSGAGNGGYTGSISVYGHAGELGNTEVASPIHVLVTTSGTSATNKSLQGTHPISVPYPVNGIAGLLKAPGSFILSSSGAQLTEGVGGIDIWPGGVTSANVTISALLYGGGGTSTPTVECESCHDVHKQIGDAPGDPYLLKIGLTDYDPNNRGDTLCRTCHIK